MLSNYYMGYMACIFSVLYFLAYFLMTAKPRPEKSGEKLTTREKYSAKNLMRHPFLNRCARFAGFSLLAGGLCAVTLLPTYFLCREAPPLPQTASPPLLSLTLPFSTF